MTTDTQGRHHPISAALGVLALALLGCNARSGPPNRSPLAGQDPVRYQRALENSSDFIEHNQRAEQKAMRSRPVPLPQ